MTKSLSTVGKILEKAQVTTLSHAFRTLFDYKSQRVELEYHKTIAVHILASKLETCVRHSKGVAFQTLKGVTTSSVSSRKQVLIKLIKQ